MTPNREGWWRNAEFGEVQVYMFEDNYLAAWCDDVGVIGGPDRQDFTHGDEACGHIPAWLLGDDWVFVKPFQEQEAKQ